MKYWALIDNAVVTNLVIQETAPDIDIPGTWVEAPDEYVLIGSSYTGGEFISSKLILVSPPLPVLPNIITKLALLNRITDAEFIGIINAAKTDAEVELWKTRFDSATTIDLADGSRIVAGFPMLVSKSLLTQERATKILTDPIQSNERS
jgi:hypothetical protein